MQKEKNLTAAEVDEHIEKLGMAANDIVSNSAVKMFFEQQEEEHRAAFESLPMDATAQQFQAVRFSMLAMRRLKLAMAQFVDDMSQTRENKANAAKTVEGV